MFPSFKKSRGFTLIELLVVISIIGTLSTIILASLNSTRAKARDAQVRLQVKQIINALHLAQNETTGLFPQGGLGNTSWTCLKSSGTCWQGQYTGDSALMTALAPYISQIPLPPNPPFNSSTYLFGGYMYLPNYPYFINTSPPGTYLIWAQSVPINDCQGWYAGNYDGNYYCYQRVSGL
jgi:prepilin-type N-terminal cleavage/methylation domain-containing protein